MGQVMHGCKVHEIIHKVLRNNDDMMSMPCLIIRVGRLSVGMTPTRPYVTKNSFNYGSTDVSAGKF